MPWRGKGLSFFLSKRYILVAVDVSYGEWIDQLNLIRPWLFIKGIILMQPMGILFLFFFNDCACTTFEALEKVQAWTKLGMNTTKRVPIKKEKRERHLS